jgi:hypothetical protein
MTKKTWLACACACAWAAVAASGCGGPEPTSGVDAGNVPLLDAAPIDGAAIDAAVDRPDGSLPPDASTPVDGGAPVVEIDAASDVDAGSAPDAAVDDAGAPECPTPGATTTMACGMCGSMSRFCTAEHTWADGPCTGESGVCMPGTVGSTACGNCGSQATQCNTSCTWVSTGTCSGEGECAPGAVTHGTTGCGPLESRDFACDATCTYVPTTACTMDGCPTPGALETVPCGMCGHQERFCNASHAWEYSGTCTGEGTCMPGTTGSTSCGYCGTAPARCDTTCSWAPSGMCSGEGLCAAGSVGACTTSCGSTGTQACSAACAPGACVAPAESCGNSRDDDCDALVDEGCAPVCGTCAGAIPVPAGGGRMMVTLGGGASAQRGTCAGLGTERALSLTLTSTSDVFISTHGATVDTVLYVRSCNCTGPELGCNDDADGRTASALRLNALAAGTYTIWVDSYTGTSTATIPVDVYVTPTGTAGDRCGNPIAITPGTTHVSGSTCGAHSDYAPVLGGACAATGTGAVEDRVYYFSLAATTTVTFSGCGTPGFEYDGVLYVRSVCTDGASAAQRACDDDGCSSLFGHEPTITATLPAGLYYLFVDGFGTGTSACGSFDVAITGL